MSRIEKLLMFLQLTAWESELASIVMNNYRDDTEASRRRILALTNRLASNLGFEIRFGMPYSAVIEPALLELEKMLDEEKQ